MGEDTNVRWWVVDVNIPSGQLYIKLDTDDEEKAWKHAETYGGVVLIYTNPR